jgi:hypothetical protein
MLSVLLGAGASYEADLPLAVDLTDKVIKIIDRPHRPLVEFVRSTLQAAAAAHASHNPYYRQGIIDGVDSESLYNTIDDLVHRDSLDIAPFVSTWHPMLTDVGRGQTPGGLSDKISNVLKGGALHHRNVHDLAQTIFDMAVGARIDKSILMAIKEAVLESVSIRDEGKVEYLRPLLSLAESQSWLAVATLNYDLTIETLCRRHGYVWSDGVSDEGSPAHVRETPRFLATGIRLFKLHGSSSWQYNRDESIVAHLKEGETAHPNSYVIRFGGKNKLTARWPLFELFWQWRQDLSKAHTLLIVGYSFRDDHVNAAIEHWFRSSQERKLVIVDPSFELAYGHMLSPLIDDISTDYRGMSVPDGTQPSGQRIIPPNDNDIRVVILRAGTGESLVELVRCYPELPIDFARKTRDEYNQRMHQ